MSLSKIVTTSFLMAVSIALTATAALGQQHHIVVPADKVQWGPVPPMLPPGAEISVLEGNPGEKGAITLRLKLPANYVIPPHWHSMDERVTVLSGTFYIGAGDTIDKAGSQALQAGGFVSLPAKMHHYAWVKTPVVVQINLEGPFDIFYINPSDDPQTKAAKP